MNDLLKWLFLCLAIIALVIAHTDHEKRLQAVEVGPSCPAHCRPIQTLLKNRPISQGPGAAHSFDRPFNICEP